MIVDMSKYTRKMVDNFKKKYDLSGTAKTFAKENLFHPSEGELLDAERAADFHTYVAKGLFSGQRGRLDARTVVSAMTTRVKEPRESDWEILLHYMRFWTALGTMC